MSKRLLPSDLRIGLERLCEEQKTCLQQRRFGIVMNRASVDRNVRLACDVLADQFPGQLKAILSPQHGLWCEQQANMVETGHGWHQQLSVPVYSLYSSTRRPTDEMLEAIDCLVIDLQDVGKRTVNRRVGFSRLVFFAWRIFGGGSVFFLLVGCRRSASGVSGCS